MKQIIVILFFCLAWGCKNDVGVTVLDCVCNDLKDYGVAVSYITPQEGVIRFNPLSYVLLTPKTDFVINAGKPYRICTDSFLLKQIAIKGIKDSDQVIIKGVKSFPDGTCRGREYVEFYNNFDLPTAMIRITDIDKK